MRFISEWVAIKLQVRFASTGLLTLMRLWCFSGSDSDSEKSIKFVRQ